MLYLIDMKALILKERDKNKLSITSITGRTYSRWGSRRLKKTLPSQRIAGYYQQLFEMSMMIIGSCPEVRPINPYQRLEKKIKLPKHLPRENLLMLYQLLVHASTVFNRTHRLRKKRKLLTSREDVINALTLLRPAAFPESMLLSSTRKFYLELLTVVEKEKEVTRKELSNLLQYHPQKIWRHVLALIEAGYITVRRKGAGGICYYRILQPEGE